MQEVTCQDCGRKIEVNLYYLDAGIDNGDYVKGRRVVKAPPDALGQIFDKYVDVIYDICKRCQLLRQPRAGDPEMLRAEQIQQQMALLIEMRPDLNADQRRAVALEDAFDPNRESNPRFRRFLLDRGEKDAATDQIAHQVMEALI